MFNPTPSGLDPIAYLGSSMSRIFLSSSKMTEYFGARACVVAWTIGAIHSRPNLAFHAGTKKRKCARGNQEKQDVSPQHNKRQNKTRGDSHSGIVHGHLQLGIDVPSSARISSGSAAGCVSTNGREKIGRRPVTRDCHIKKKCND